MDDGTDRDDPYEIAKAETTNVLGPCSNDLFKIEPTSSIGRVKSHNNNGNSNPQALVFKDFHEFFLPGTVLGNRDY